MKEARHNLYLLIFVLVFIRPYTLIASPADSSVKRMGTPLNAFLDLPKKDRPKWKPQRPANIKNKRVLYLNQSPHFNHHKLYKDSAQQKETSWDNLQELNTNYHPANEVETGGTELDTSIEVMGFHPYWMGSAYQAYMMNFLSTVAYFCYDVNPYNGTYHSIYNWNTTPLVDSVKNNGRKIVLTVANMGHLNNYIFLSRPEAQKTLISQVIKLLEQRGGDGVCLDFEEVPGSTRKAFTSFVIAFDNSLKAANPAYRLSLCLPAVDYAGAFEVDTLKNHVDLFVLMGYDYYAENSKTAGPNAPLFSHKPWEIYSVDQSVDYYLKLGLAPSQILLAVPYYGTLWKTKSANLPSDKISFINNLPYYRIKDEFAEIQAGFDSCSSSEYHLFMEGLDYYQLWLDGQRSLSLKYQYVLQKKLKGIAIWTLGYDNGYPELWKLLVQHFSSSAIDSFNKLRQKDGTLLLPHLDAAADKPVVHSAKDSLQEIDEPGPDQLFKRFLKIIGKEGNQQVIVLMILIILAVFFLLGFLIAFTNYNLTMFFKDRLVAVYMVVSIVICVVIFILTISHSNSEHWEKFAEGVMVTILFMSLLYLITRQKKELP